MTLPNLSALSLALSGSLIFLALAATRSFAAESEPLVIPLWSGVAPGSEGYTQEEVYEDRGADNGWVAGVNKPTMTVYQPAAEKGVGTGIVICPGGGYGGLAIDHEGHALARWFAERGVVASVLKYRCGGGQHKHPVPLNDAQRALRIMRSLADEWQLKTNQIGIAGFSAGGHLASTAGTRFDEGDANAEDPVERVSCRANFMVLAYPVITMQEELTHQGSKSNLLGSGPSDESVRLFSNELQVTAEAGPAFITHSEDDTVVPVENALLFYQSLRKHKVPAELHVYATGGHGYGMFRSDEPAAQWPNLLEAWLKEQKLVK